VQLGRVTSGSVLRRVGPMVHTKNSFVSFTSRSNFISAMNDVKERREKAEKTKKKIIH
jgi:hypothetical protein